VARTSGGARGVSGDAAGTGPLGEAATARTRCPDASARDVPLARTSIVEPQAKSVTETVADSRAERVRLSPHSPDPADGHDLPIPVRGETSQARLTDLNTVRATRIRRDLGRPRPGLPRCPRAGIVVLQRLPQEQHPDLAGLPLTLVAGGWDNQMWRPGGELARV
jgi:hypothetical protein